MIPTREDALGVRCSPALLDLRMTSASFVLACTLGLGIDLLFARPARAQQPQRPIATFRIVDAAPRKPRSESVPDCALRGEASRAIETVAQALRLLAPVPQLIEILSAMTEQASDEYAYATTRFCANRVSARLRKALGSDSIPTLVSSYGREGVPGEPAALRDVERGYVFLVRAYSRP